MPGLISLDDAKDHVAVEDDSRDVLLQRLIDTAGRHIEGVTGYVAVQRQETFVFDTLGRALELRLRPVDPDSIVVTYLDGNGDEQNVSDFRVVEKNGTTRILPAVGFCFPCTLCQPGSVSVTADVGFLQDEDDQADGAPETLRHAARLCVGTWFQDRETGNIPKAVDQLLDDERARRT